VISAVTLISLPLRPVFQQANLAMFYLLGVVAVAMRANRTAALLASILSVAAFDFFCVPPYLTFAVSDYEYVITFAVMLIVAVVISSLTVRVRLQAVHAAQREARTQALYRLTRNLSTEAHWVEAGRKLSLIVREATGAKVVLFVPGDSDRISFRRRSSDDLPVPSTEEAIAQWVFDHAQPAGKGTNTLSGASALYLPLKGSQSVLGVLAVIDSGPNTAQDPEQQHLLEVFAGHTALAIERAQAAAEARNAQLRAETEQMRSGMLSAVSHDLRTPLAAITGAASSLRLQGRQMSDATKEELLESIELEADRLSRLVNNLLEMTRLDSGSVVLKREWHPLEDIIGAALTRLDRLMEGRPISTDVPSGLMASVDDVLFEQVLWNVFENAIKYTPDGSAISVSARPQDRGVTVEIADAGPGFAPGEENLVWDKFYRGDTKRAGGAAGTRGAGLGLTISRAIVQAHGGRIEAQNRPGGGALIRIWIPNQGQPPELPNA
jgi:two-component system sensor histidine kinase KdpD